MLYLSHLGLAGLHDLLCQKVVRYTSTITFDSGIAQCAERLHTQCRLLK